MELLLPVFTTFAGIAAGYFLSERKREWTKRDHLVQAYTEWIRASTDTIAAIAAHDADQSVSELEPDSYLPRRQLTAAEKMRQRFRLQASLLALAFREESDGYVERAGDITKPLLEGSALVDEDVQTWEKRTLALVEDLRKRLGADTLIAQLEEDSTRPLLG